MHGQQLYGGSRIDLTQELVDEDRLIGAKKLGIRADAVRVIPVEDVVAVFRKDT